jgi:hypothetical protein
MLSFWVISSIGSALRMGNFCVEIRNPLMVIDFGFFASGETVAHVVAITDVGRK